MKSIDIRNTEILSCGESRLMPQVNILLATHNGEKYLLEQLRSIENQTYPFWTLTVSDDYSSDNTIAIIRTFSKLTRNTVKILSPRYHGSAQSNFFYLLRKCDRTPLYALCDQDDIWVPEKLEKLVGAIVPSLIRREPSLAYSDITVVDKDLQVVAPSFQKQIRAFPSRLSFRSLLSENSVPGCAVMFNDQLLQLLRTYEGTIPKNIMHDWLIALLAAGAGSLTYVDKSLALYRQHASNAAGAVNRRSITYLYRKAILNLKENNEIAAYVYSRFIADNYSLVLKDRFAKLVRAVSEIGEYKKVQRMILLLRNLIVKQTLSRTVWQIVRA